MSKELEALKEIERVCKDSNYQVGFYKPKLELIETALKKQAEDEKKLKDLERKYYIETLSIDCKKLKALEIIKSWLSKSFIQLDENMVFIKFEEGKFYYYIVPEAEKEEYDLLKEVLK